MNDPALAVTATVAGALLGGVATWWLQSRLHHLQRQEARNSAVMEKLHQLDMRIVKVEAELRVLNSIGYLRTPEEDDPDA